MVLKRSTEQLWMEMITLSILLLTATMTMTMTMTMTTTTNARPRRILVDTDVDTDDVISLLYLLKQNKTEFDLQAITINANGWSDSGHAVNHVYDMLFMMGRDEIPVGVGGEGAILLNSTVLPNVGGYLPIIDQGTSTAGECRYRQSIPVGRNGRLDVNSNFGLRRSFLPQGERRYKAVEQATAQQVMVDAVSAGPISILVMGAHTNLGIFVMSNPELKKNVEHIYAMGGAVDSTMSGEIGNLFPQHSNPFAEFNIFADPFAAYTVLHSGIPVTLVPLDATRTIPVDENFFSAFQQNQRTFEAQYCFQSLKMARDTWINNDFHMQYCMWDSFMVGVALSQMRSENELMNEFAVMKYVNITVVTSNEPYGTSDGSNPLVDGRLYNNNPKFGVKENGVHSGHVQLGMQDQFCLVNGNKGKCQDGYTKKVSGDEAVKVLIATEAKPNSDTKSSLSKEFYKSFLDLMNRPAQSGRFNVRTQFPYYEETLFKPFFGKRLKGKAVVFDMDMSAGDFLALFYLLKLPLELIDLKGILISANGWANAATVDIVYDILHMMGRDDIPVGVGDVFATGQPFPAFPALGGCAFTKFIPHGRGGFLDSDTLYGLARHLPRSPRAYTAENSVKFGAPRDTDNPELRQPSALDVWKSVVSSLNPRAKVTILTNGPLTNLAQIINLSENTTSLIQDVYIVGGHITGHGNNNEKGNLFTFPSNEFAEFNMFLDPLAAKTVLGSKLNITLIPLRARRQVSTFGNILKKMKHVNKTPEAVFTRGLLLELRRLQLKDERYLHVDTFLGEILGAVILAAENQSEIGQTFEFKSLNVLADQREMSRIGQTVIDESEGKRVKVLKSVNEMAYYDNIVKLLGDHRQSALIGSFEDQKRIWSDQPKSTNIIYQAFEANLLVGSIVLFFLFAICIRNKVTKK